MHIHGAHQSPSITMGTTKGIEQPPFIFRFCTQEKHMKFILNTISAVAETIPDINSRPSTCLNF